jgi:hypothetical protein
LVAGKESVDVGSQRANAAEREPELKETQSSSPSCLQKGDLEIFQEFPAQQEKEANDWLATELEKLSEVLFPLFDFRTQTTLLDYNGTG